ncbi:MAG: ribonuclease HII [Cyanobacteria bacterium J083]|nr:MAG: ribonuclease HII [Cyanobacteria bacterium J083]
MNSIITRQAIIANLGNLSEIFPENSLIAGVDEVGRGCLFGPVVAAAVVMPVDKFNNLAQLGVKDSKQLSARRRQKLDCRIKQQVINWQIGYATVAEIDRLNILQASLLAMRRSVNKLRPQPQHCLIDGNHLIPDCHYSQTALIKGDQNCLLIAAASILAKVWRDNLMINWSGDYPEYGLAQNKGYGTKAHRAAIYKYGYSRQHRKSFKLNFRD